MDPLPAEGNFCDDSNRPMKPHIVEQYNRHMDYVDNSDRMANSYSVSRHTFKWTTKFFFHLLDLTVLNSRILLSSCGSKYTHRDFRLLLVRNLIEEAGKSQDCLTLRLVGRPSAAASNVLWLESHHNKHWAAKSSTHLLLSVFFLQPKKANSLYKCARCDVGLCMVPCFEKYHKSKFVNHPCCE